MRPVRRASCFWWHESFMAILSSAHPLPSATHKQKPAACLGHLGERECSARTSELRQEQTQARKLFTVTPGDRNHERPVFHRISVSVVSVCLHVLFCFVLFCLFVCFAGETLVNVLDFKKDMGLWHGVLTVGLSRAGLRSVRGYKVSSSVQMGPEACL